MIVLDASILVPLVADDGRWGEQARARLAADTAAVPDHIDVEVMSALRRLCLNGELTAPRFSAAVDDLMTIRLARYPITPFLRRAYELRPNVTPYDAVYIALAEAFGCTLVTADARLARSPGIRCEVEVLS